MWQDLRYALRKLRNTPVYALTAVLTLALGLGAATAMLAIVDSVLLRPVNLPHAERIVSLERALPADKRAVYFEYADLDALRRSSRTFAALGGYSQSVAIWKHSDGPHISNMLEVEPGYFAVPGVPARLGRLLDAHDAGTGNMVINDLFWRGVLHADPHAIGRTLRLGEFGLTTVVGVLPPGPSLPNYLAATESVYLPIERRAIMGRGDLASNILIAARLRPGVIRKQAEAEASAVYAHGPAASDPRRGTLVLEPYSLSLVRGQQPALYALLAACSALLLIACANWANLQLARAAARLGEVELRAALGVTPARLARQIATESLAVSFLGAAFGLLLARAAVAGIRAAYGTEYTRFNELAVHTLAFVGCALLAVAAGLLAALAPALAASLRARSLGTHVGQTAHVTRRSRLSEGLVAGEVALTCVLLVCAGLFLRTFRALTETPLGFDPSHVTTVTLTAFDQTEPAPELQRTYDRVLARLARIPGVEAAATQTSLPFAASSLLLANDFRIAGQPKTADQVATVSLLNPDYTRALRVHPVEGRFSAPATPRPPRAFAW